MKPRIVMLFSMSFQPYQGRYLRVYNQAKTLVEAGYDVILLAWDRDCASPEKEVRDGIEIRRFHIPAGVGQGPKNVLNVLKFNRAAFRYLMTQPFDIVHCYNLDAVVTSLAAARLRKKKAVLDLCEPEYYAFWDKKFSWFLKGINQLEIGLARRFDHLFVHNLYQVRKFRARGISHLTQVGSYPNRALMPSEITKESDGECVIGRIGTIYENNGIEELIAAFERLLERKQQRGGGGLSYRLFLAGRIYDSFRPTFDALVGPLKEYVDVHGAFQAADLPRLYGKIDISVMISRRTRWFQNITPTKLFDSLLNGVPVVANDIGDIAEILGGGPCGVIVDESDTDSICSGIERLALDPSLRLEMAKNALRSARDKYTWEAYKEEFLLKYRTLSM
ncbi:MAG: glycosyltransferase [Thermodesulfobacteriota bacterium]|nr:glycosyltransferase [Thermodesulfobacteriota bacterium]